MFSGSIERAALFCRFRETREGTLLMTDRKAGWPHVAVRAVLCLAAILLAAGTHGQAQNSAQPNVIVTQAIVVGAGQFSPRGPGREVPPPAQKLPEFCRFTATLTPTRDSEIKIDVWMPTTGWNGKFLGVGNGGWAGSRW